MKKSDKQNGDRTKTGSGKGPKSRSRPTQIETPIEQAMNIGPTVAPELRSLGIETLEKLQELGWEQAYIQWAHAYPRRLHPIAAYALAGAVARTNAFSIPGETKVLCKALVRQLKAEKST